MVQLAIQHVSVAEKYQRTQILYCTKKKMSLSPMHLGNDATTVPMLFVTQYTVTSGRLAGY